MRQLLYSTKQPYGPLDLLSLPWVNASWRPPCKAFSPALEPFCYSSTGFMLLGMVLGYSRTPRPLRRWIRVFTCRLPSKVAQVSSQMESRRQATRAPRNR